MALGPHHLRERVKGKTKEKSTPTKDSTLKPYGATYTNATVTPPIGVLIILIELEAPPRTLRDPGARHVTGPVIPLIHAMPHRSAFLAKVRVRPKEARVLTAIVLGKAKTSQPRITPIRPLRPCMKPPLPPPIKTGGLNKSSDPLLWTTTIWLIP
jgi:hypothetical protein